MSKIKSRLFLAGAAGAVMTFSAAAFLAAPGVNAQSQDKAAPAAKQVTASDAGPGAVIAIDPATGKTRTPEPSEINALQASRGKEQRKTAPVTYVLPGGGVALVADPSMDCAMVASKTTEGKVKTDCVVGQETASAIVKSQQNQPVKEKLDEK